MRIIKEGTIKKEIEMTCPECGCVFVIEKKKDVEFDFREGECWVHCPTCGNVLAVDIRQAERL